eukprot:UN01827
MDCIILGGYFGDGSRRSGDLSHFLLGVCDPPENPGDDPKNFYSFCKVGTGYKLHELAELRNKLEKFWKPFIAGMKLPHMVEGWTPRF